MDIEKLVSILSQVQYKQSLDWYVYLLVILSSGIGAFLISFFKEKGKKYATKNDFNNLERTLRDHTKLVEGIKSEFSEQIWINQQLFPKKQEIFRLATKVICNFREFMQSVIQEQTLYHYIEFEHCGFSSGGGYDVPYDAEPKYHIEAERLEKEFWQFAEKEINLERAEYSKKYRSKEHIEKQNLLSESVLSSIDEVLNLINMNKAILSENTITFSLFFNEIKTILTDNPTMGKIYNKELEGLANYEISEFYIEKNQKLLSKIDEQYSILINLTKVELGINKK